MSSAGTAKDGTTRRGSQTRIARVLSRIVSLPELRAHALLGRLIAELVAGPSEQVLHLDAHRSSER